MKVFTNVVYRFINFSHISPVKITLVLYISGPSKIKKPLRPLGLKELKPEIAHPLAQFYD